MRDIRLLKRNIYELIAAGEVILNPCSIVKELVENSIDAMASFVSVEIKNGGKSLIRVVDDGIGIKNKQLKLAFLKHSTSKIKDEEDLTKIKTLGFRGEALFSIAAVSKVLITTKTKNEKLGGMLKIEGSQEKSFSLVPCSNGTTIEVKDVFYNIPARLKFLKSNSKEAGLIENVMQNLALSNTNISFELKKDSKKVMQTFKSLNEKDVIYNIFGKEFCENLISLEFEDENVKIKGFVTKPTYSKSYRSIQQIFVNFRAIKNKHCVETIEEAFKGSIKPGRFPCFIIYLTVPFKDVDVNVHPNKIEVRFAKEKEILNGLNFAVRQAIFKNNNSFLLEKDLKKEKEILNPSFEFKSSVKDYEVEMENELKNFKYLSTAKIKKPEKVPEKIIENEVKNNEAQKDFLNIHKIENLKPEQKKMLDSIIYENSETNEKKDEDLKFNVSKFRVIGEIFKLYVLVEFENYFIIIDKHAAHEKILYEKLKKNNSENLERQILISPIKILLNSSEDCEIALNNYDFLIRFGFLIEHFEGNLILIREIPLILSHENCKEIFEEILNKIKNNKKNFNLEKLDEIYALIACKGAIKHNEINGYEELKKLAEQTYFNSNIRNCPHGRPAIFVYEKERLDKKFERK